MWRILFTFVITVIFLYGAYRFSRYVGRGMGIKSSGYMRMIDHMVVGQESRVVIVQIGTRYVLLGITGKQINFLTEIQNEDLIKISMDREETKGKNMDFRKIVETIGNWKNGSRQGK